MCVCNCNCASVCVCVCNAWQFVFNQGETGSVWAATKNIIYVAQPNAPVDFPSFFFRECIVYSNINTHSHTHIYTCTGIQTYNIYLLYHTSSSSHRSYNWMLF